MARRLKLPLPLIVVCLLVVGLAVMVYAIYQRDIQGARQRIATGSDIARTACGPIEYAVTGDGPPVLVVHGAGGGFDQGMGYGVELARRGFRVVAMSRFGYLRTPLPADAAPAAQADAHACLLDVLGIERAAVIGISAGGPSSLQFSLRHPRRTAALVLLVPAVYVPRAENAPSVTPAPGTEFIFDTALRSDFLFWAAIRLARETLTKAILATPPAVVETASVTEQKRARLMLDSILPVSPRRLGLLNDSAVTTSLPRYDLEQVKVPTLTISMKDDLFGTYDGARYTADQIPGAKFIGYDRGGHIWIGHHEEILSQIEHFLK